MSRIDPKSVNILKQLKRQAAKRKKRSLEVLGAGTSTPILDVVPQVATLQPSNPKKRGRSAKTSHPRIEIGSSSYSPSVLVERLQLAQGVQVAMKTEEESIPITISTSDLVAELTKMLSRSLVVSRTLGNELEMHSSTLVAKLKVELDESSSSLKSTLEAIESLDEKYRQVNAEVDEAKDKVSKKQEHHYLK